MPDLVKNSRILEGFESVNVTKDIADIEFLDQGDSDEPPGYSLDLKTWTESEMVIKANFTNPSGIS